MSAPRLFNHEEAARRRAAGESAAVLAADYGVTDRAISLAIRRLDPAQRAAINSYNKAYLRRRYRKPCVRGCGRTAWYHQGRGGVCIRCRAAEKATTVREGELLCSECGVWQPDDAFPHQAGRIARRARHGVCRNCQAADRKRRRDRRKIPCTECGAPRLSPADTGRKDKHADTGLCVICYRATLRRAAA